MSKQVQIPFLRRFERPLLEGTKVTTARSNIMGMPKDTFRAYGALFEITEVTKITEEDLRDNYWKDEGFVSPEELVDVWNQIHPRVGFNPGRYIYLHRFSKI